MPLVLVCISILLLHLLIECMEDTSTSEQDLMSCLLLLMGEGSSYISISHQ